MRLLLLVLLPFASLGASAASTTPAGKLRALVAQAAAADNAAAATALCGALAQAQQTATNLGRNINAVREWEEVVSDCQEAISKLRSPEAVKVFLTALKNLPPPGQVVLLLGLKEHPADAGLDDPALELLAKARDFQLKVAGLDLLGAHRCRAAIPAALKCLTGPELIPVRIAACRALGVMQDKAAVGPLIAYLRTVKSGRLRYEANAALRMLTSQVFIADAGLWENWWSKNEAGFVAPPTAACLNYELQLDPGQDLSYYEIPMIEDRIVFVIDTSGSMEYGGKPNRLDKARTELKALLTRLPERIQFNIILFNSNLKRWQKAPLVPATAANRKLAQDFLDKAQPGGATLTMSALEEALWDIAVNQGVETVYLLTDGQPTPMNHTPVVTAEDYVRSNEAVRRRIRFINQTLKVRLNTIGVYTRTPNDPEEKEVVRDSMKAFLENVASDNDGVYREVP